MQLEGHLPAKVWGQLYSKEENYSAMTMLRSARELHMRDDQKNFNRHSQKHVVPLYSLTVHKATLVTTEDQPGLHSALIHNKRADRSIILPKAWTFTSKKHTRTEKNKTSNSRKSSYSAVQCI